MRCSPINDHFITYSIILLTCAIGLLSLPSTVDADDYDYSVENRIIEIRDSDFFISPDGLKICVRSINSLSIYDVSTCILMIDREFEDIKIYDGCWIGDEIIIATRNKGDGTFPAPIYVLSSESLDIINEHTPTDTYFDNLIPSPTGKYIAANKKDSVFVFDTSEYELKYESDIHSYRIKTISWDFKEERIATGGENLYVHDIIDGKAVKISESTIHPRVLLWTLDGEGLYNLESVGTMEYYNVTAGELEFEEGISNRIEAGDRNPQANDVVFVSGDKWIIMSLSTLEKRKIVNEDAGVIRTIIWDWSRFRIFTLAGDDILRIYRDRNDPNYNSPPTITITSPIQAQTVSGNFTARGSITDDEQVLAAYYKLNDKSWTLLDVSGPWEFEITGASMIGGMNTLVVKASDGDYEGIEMVTFKYVGPSSQGGPPTIEILSPDQGSTVRDDMDVRLEISGGQGDIENVEIRLNVGEWTGYVGSRFFNLSIDVSDLPEGELILDVKATDGDEYSKVARVLLDHEVPHEKPDESVGKALLVIAIVVVAIVVTAVILHRRRS